MKMYLNQKKKKKFKYLRRLLYTFSILHINHDTPCDSTTKLPVSQTNLLNPKLTWETYGFVGVFPPF